MLYMVTFTINIPQMLAYIPYMDPMSILLYIAVCVCIHIYIYIHTLCTYIRDFYAPKTARSHWPIGPAMNTPGSFASHSPDSANRWPRFKQQAATQFLGDST